MKIYKFIMASLSVILIMGILVSCGKESSNTEEYKYGVVFTTIEKEKSIISTYSQDGKHLFNKEINIGGISLASFIQNGIKINDDIFYACPVVNNLDNEYVMKLDMKTMETEKVKSKDGITPTFFCVDNNFVYSGSSTLAETYLSKTDLNKNEIEGFTQLEGQGILSVNDDKNIYVVSIIHDENGSKESFAKIYILNKENLNVINELEIPNVTFISDIKVIDNKLYALINRDGNDNISNKIVEINLEDLCIKTIELQIAEATQIHYFNNSLYIAECSFNFDETKKRIDKIDLSTMSIETFNTNNEHISTIISDNNFISSDGENVYIYDISDFTLLNSFPIEMPENMIFVSIYDCN